MQWRRQESDVGGKAEVVWGTLGRKSPSGVQGRRPGEGLGGSPQKLKNKT